MSISLLRQAQYKNANSYNASSAETGCKTGYKNAKYSIIKMDCVTLVNKVNFTLG